MGIIALISARVVICTLNLVFVLKFADRIFLQQLVELKAQVRLNTEMLQSLTKMVEDLTRSSAAVGASTRGATPKLPSNVELPMKTFQQVSDLEQLLSHPAEKQKLVIMHTTCYFNTHISVLLKCRSLPVNYSINDNVLNFKFSNCLVYFRR